MARDSSGTKNEPIYDPNGVPADAADLTELGAYAALVGNRKVMSSAERALLAGKDRWVGLEVFETDTLSKYVYTAAGWRLSDRLNTPYTPSWTALNPGSGATVTGAYSISGGYVFGNINAVLGSGAAASGSIYASLPIQSALSNDHIGTFFLTDASGSGAAARGSGVVESASGGTTCLMVLSNGNTVNQNTPWSWAAGDNIRIQFMYPAV